MNKFKFVLAMLALSPLLLTGGGCAKTDSHLQSKIVVTPIDSPSAKSGAEPNLIVGADGAVYLSWIEKTVADSVKTSHLYFARRADGAWSESRLISEGQDWFVNWADFPELAVADNGSMIASWLSKSGEGTYAYDVWLARSDDNGQNWKKSFRPHDDGTETEHGFVSLLPLGAGRFSAVWLDGRQMAEDGPMTIRYAEIESNGELQNEELIDERVCDCCQTSSTLTGTGATLIAYRDRSEAEIRDISVARLADGEWSVSQLTSSDNWHMPGCPVNGPALDASEATVALAWFTRSEDNTPKALVAFSSDDGKTFDAPIRVDNGAPEGRVDVCMIDDKSALVSWLEITDSTGKQAEVQVRLVQTDGAMSKHTLVATTSPKRASGFPQLVKSSGGAIMAWTALEEDKKSAVKTAKITVQ